MDQARKKNIRRIIALVCVVAVVAFLAAMPLIARPDPEENGPKASILSDTVSVGSIHTELIGGGQLAEQSAAAVSVPAAVKLTEYLVSNGEHVTAGTALAAVDRVTVMYAITQVQQTMEYLSGQIEKAGKTDDEETVRALAGGTVKIVYAEEGDGVQDAMLEHGALAVLSLDGLMALDLETETAWKAGSEVIVTFSDGTEISGRVEKNLAGTMTVTVEDDGYAVGDTVQVAAEDETVIGSGELYIYSPWNATAYAGIVDTVSVNVGDILFAGDELMVLSQVGYSATYLQLVGQRQEYEQLMEDLFRMYQTQTITAPCDGVVSGISEDSTQLLAAYEQRYGMGSSTGTSEDAVRSGEDRTETGTTTTTGTSGMTYPGTGSFPAGDWGSMTEKEPEFEMYSLDMVQIAAVTPQSAMTMEITVDELDITALQVGMTAQVKIDALGGEKHAASITQIGNTGENNGGNSKYTVELTMNRAENMLSGMNATAVIVLETTGDVLTVPADALVERGNQTLVYTGYDEESEMLLNPVAVTVGCSDGETVEILEGLSAGQTYYYAYYDTLVISFTPDFGGGGFMFG